MPCSEAASPDLVLAMLADARLPSGGHTQSAGLEPALRAGLPPAHIPQYLQARIRSVVAVDAGTAVVARRVVLDGGGRAELNAVTAAWAARTPSPALRASSGHLGRGYLRLLLRLWPDDPAAGFLDSASPRPVVLGVVAAAAGLSAAQLVRLVGYDDVQAVVSAALKLEPLDPLDTTAWVLEAHPAIEALVPRLEGLRDHRRIPAAGAPLIEAWADAHTRTARRLFSA